MAKKSTRPKTEEYLPTKAEINKLIKQCKFVESEKLQALNKEEDEAEAAEQKFLETDKTYLALQKKAADLYNKRLKMREKERKAFIKERSELVRMLTLDGPTKELVEKVRKFIDTYGVIDG